MIKLRIIFLIFITISVLSGCSTLKDPLHSEPERPQQKMLTEKPSTETLLNNSIINQNALGLEQENLWDEIANNLYITPIYTKKMKEHLTLSLRKKNNLEQISIRAQPFLYFIYKEVKSRQLPYEIIFLPMVESSFLPKAISHAGAAGIWQFMPRTGNMLGLKQNWWHDGRLDIYNSTHAALDYLQTQYKRNNNDWLLALASYNAGHGNVRKAKRNFLKNNPKGEINFWNISPYLPKETQNYVPRILAFAYLVKHGKRYNINLHSIDNKPYFQKIHLTQQTSTSSIIKHTGISKHHFHLLNPAFLKSATPPQGPHHLLLPLKDAHDFKLKFSANPSLFKVNWEKHKIRQGDSLGLIAQKYQTSVREIKNLNNMNSSRIRAGKTLLIPIPKQYTQTTLAQEKTKTRQTKTHTHKVKANESLSVIAQNHNTTVQKISQINKINSKDLIKKGQILQIPVQKNEIKIIHILKKGENLTVLAKKYNTNTQQIARWNQIQQSDILQTGKKLKIWISS